MQHTRMNSLYNRFKRRLLSRVFLARTIIVCTIILLVCGSVLLVNSLSRGFLTQIAEYTKNSVPLHAGRINFLLLGIGGGDHEGPDLTDTIIFMSIDSANGNAVFLSIPRDVWISSIRAKINTAFHFGSEKAGTAGGLALSKSVVSQFINQPIDFAIVVDFSTFKQAIDLLGGIDVNIQNSFVDTQYPIPGKENDNCGGDPQFLCRYETVTFSKGLTHMDGITALKFARSRHSTDPAEGTDFARSKRQEKVIAAFKSKLFSQNIQTYKQLLGLVRENVITDIKPENYLSLSKIAIKMKKQNISTYSLSEPDQLYQPDYVQDYDFSWVLLPKNNDPRVVFDFVTSLLK